MSVRIARVAVAAPLHSLFDYQIPATVEVAVGSRVRVSFGHTRPIGVVVAIVDSTDRPGDSLKSLEAVLDREPLLRQQDLDFLTWAAAYYHHPIGEIVAAALPLRLRKADKMLPAGEPAWALTAEGRQLAHDLVRRAPRQAEILGWLSALPTGQAPQAVLRAALPDSGSILRVLHGKGWIKPLELPATPDVIDQPDAGPRLNPEQLAVLDALSRDIGRFAVALLDGVTGSGKTEVYLQLAAVVLARGKGVLVLVPEISLTPQLLARFRERLGDTVRVLHSGLTESEREQTWQRMRLGLSHVLLGTRSAIFTPLADLGLVVVDEEHDPSFKQTEGFRYSARDLAVVRAQRSGCPVVLGSATPSLESLRNA
ncbi:MAG: DEAD/DEAH box helicase, partial [Sedimenticolaceae bacterium]